MSSKILCIGELLIDFICSDINSNLIGGRNFIKKAGGAPANVTAAISKLGGEASFAGKVGNDPFGLFLKKTLEDVNVDTSMLVLDNKASTTLAFVSLESDGERDFVFNRGADEGLSFDELNENSIVSSKIIHFGSATALLGGNLKETYFKVMAIAKERNIFISFDPNYRVDLWNGRIQQFIEISRKCLKYSDLVKVSEEEIKIITGQDNIESGIKKFHDLGAKLVAVTLGKEGTLISNGEKIAKVNSIEIKSIDSTGAGDAFVGACLYKIAKLDDTKKLVEDFDKMIEITSFANKVGAIVCTKLGAISALPDLDEVEIYR
ncbi:fructokinase [Clostridium zeae]|uniref:Fructokinase n=1 Tax=Clostridium zeae TaxID=2759022 RepID=A0ABQ1EBL8_9CLOT|nr:carbohydrate kinase [Clostridium zeae]GFZ32098.1 fructokinase [Clostridium zeae]